MADRVSASIIIGGKITPADYRALCDIIASERLSTEWDGEPFEPADHISGDPLKLFAHEVSGGRFPTLEDWCIDRQVPFSRWSASYPGQWSCKRVVFPGTGEPAEYATDEHDNVLTSRDTAQELGSLEAILGHFEAAGAAIPPLVIDPDGTMADDPSDQATC